jgi:hypothetical protein
VGRTPGSWNAVHPLDGERFATFHAYDPGSRILSLRLRFPREGVLECKDVALDAALKRLESAIDHFVEDAAVNPQLGRLLLYPEENRIGDMDPLELFQPLEPAVEMQSVIHGPETRGRRAYGCT